MKKFFLLAVLTGVIAISGLNHCNAQAQMVKDINPVSTLNSSSPSKFVTISGITYFTAYDNDYGTELWKTDGTPAGTVMVKDISAGVNSSSPNYLINVNGTLFFTATSGGNGYELMKSDGTEEGTVVVKDIYPTSLSSFPSQFAVIGSILYFQANDGTNGYELWKSDGTEAGTDMVKDINSGSSNSSPMYITPVGSNIYFSANDGSNGIELWVSDGTTAGTSMVKDIFPSGSSFPSNLKAIGSTLFFSASDNLTGNELWKSNGTGPGTTMVKDIDPVASGSPSYLTVLGTSLFFSASEPTGGQELWKCDSPYNSGSTSMVIDINPGVGNSSPQYITNVNGILYFSANDGVNGAELWASGGDAGSTGMVKDIYSGASWSSPSNFCAHSNVLYFQANDGTNGQELWRSNGTSGGTYMVKDIETGANSSLPQYLYSSGTFLIFCAYTSTSAYEPWISNGTSGGTSLLLNINPEIGYSSPYFINTLVDTLFFFANDGVNGNELWRSDGTSGGTFMVKDINPGINNSLYGGDGFIKFNGLIFFTATDGVNGYELWKTDLTAAGTVMVKDIYSGSNSSTPRYFQKIGSTLYFWANDGVNGSELWKTDGTTAGTVMVKDIYPGAGSSTPSGAFLSSTINYGADLYFLANDGTNGYELWKSDGTSGGTILVKNINPGIASSSPAYFFKFNGNLFFSANDGVNGNEFWITDGTTGGTTLLKDINPGSGSSYITGFYDMGGTILLGANDGTGIQLWKSDGTTGGTVIVKTIYPGYTGGASIGVFSTINSTIYFRAKDGTAGYELWKTDGTTAGTVMIKDIDPGAAYSSVPANFTAYHDTCFFSARTVASGNELYVSNGTAQSTAMAADIFAGSGSSSPSFLATTSKGLFFAANDGINGRELWKLTMPAALSRTVTGTNPVCNSGSNGSINVTVAGGTLPYSYAWSNSATTEDVSGLTAGTYSVVITDSWGWATSHTVTLTQPASTTVSVSSQTNVTCFGGSNGAVALSVTGGGAAPYSYLWSPGGSTTQNLTGLTADTYSVLVTDALGCTNSFSTQVTQPQAVAATLTVTNTSCNLGSNGSATASVTTGVPSYTYLWSANASSQTTQTATGLGANDYSVTVTDGNGCTGTFTTSVSQPTAYSTTVTVTNENCSGGSNGGADLSVSGATAPYTYSWSNGATTQDITNVLSANYTVTITDSKGCTKTSVAAITQPATFLGPITSTNVSCYGLCNGTATVTATGGTSPYIYSWQTTPAQSTQIATGLCQGTYNLSITDNHGCVITPNVIITQPAVLTASVTNTGATCSNNDGTATVTPAGGTSPYTYAWNSTPAQTTQTAANLALGNYSVSVTDSKGCTASSTTTITATTIERDICIVTVDSTSTKNVIVWEKPAVTNIDSFLIYRDIASVYTKIGAADFAAPSQFVDNTAGVNPNITSYRYKIAARDNCGGISAQSPYHKTIHLQTSPAVPTGYQLNWDDYLGFTITQYRILRDTNNLHNWVAIDSVPFGITSYTDVNPWDSVGYMIEIDHPNGCVISSKNPNPMATNLNSSRSNVYRTGGSVTHAVSYSDDPLVHVYPNPNSGVFTVDIKDRDAASATVKVFNVLGAEINSILRSSKNKITVDLSKEAKGVYYITITDKDSTVTRKIIIE